MDRDGAGLSPWWGDSGLRMNWDIGLWEDSCEDGVSPGAALVFAVMCGNSWGWLHIDRSVFPAVTVAIPPEPGTSGLRKAWFLVDSTIPM